MTDPARSEVTAILRRVCASEATTEITSRLFQAVYDELRSIAARLMHRERADHTLDPTALVHEAYLRLVDESKIDWQGRSHFLGIAARAMRQILVDHARRRGAAKRGGSWDRVSINETIMDGATPPTDVLKLHGVLEKLTALDQRAGRVAELRIFGGLTVREIAHVLSISKRTADSDWKIAKPWITRALLETA